MILEFGPFICVADCENNRRTQVDFLRTFYLLGDQVFADGYEIEFQDYIDYAQVEADLRELTFSRPLLGVGLVWRNQEHWLGLGKYQESVRQQPFAKALVGARSMANKIAFNIF